MMSFNYANYINESSAVIFIDSIISIICVVVILPYSEITIPDATYIGVVFPVRYDSQGNTNPATDRKITQYSELPALQKSDRFFSF